MKDLKERLYQELITLYPDKPEDIEKHHLDIGHQLEKEYQTLSSRTLERQRTAYKKVAAKAIKEKWFHGLNKSFVGPKDRLSSFELYNQLRLARITAKVSFDVLDENGERCTEDDNYKTLFAFIIFVDHKNSELYVGVINQSVAYINIPLSDIKEIQVFNEAPYTIFTEIGYSDLRRNLLQREL